MKGQVQYNVLTVAQGTFPVRADRFTIEGEGRVYDFYAADGTFVAAFTVRNVVNVTRVVLAS